MSVEQPDVVDIISTDRKTGDVVLTVSDHLDWSEGVRHQVILQAKLNRYLAFVETGEILDRYPEAKGKQAVFKVVFRFPPSEEGLQFLARAREVISRAGLSLIYEILGVSGSKL